MSRDSISRLTSTPPVFPRRPYARTGPESSGIADTGELSSSCHDAGLFLSSPDSSSTGNTAGSYWHGSLSLNGAGGSAQSVAVLSGGRVRRRPRRARLVALSSCGSWRLNICACWGWFRPWSWSAERTVCTDRSSGADDDDVIVTSRHAHARMYVHAPLPVSITRHWSSAADTTTSFTTTTTATATTTRSSAIAGRPCDAKACQLIAEMDVEMTT